MDVVKEVKKFDIRMFEKLQRRFPEISKSYELVQDVHEGIIEDPSVAIRLEKGDDAITIDLNECVTNVKFEVTECVSAIGKPFICFKFTLKDGDYLEVSFWHDSARKLIEFFNETIERLKEEI